MFFETAAITALENYRLLVCGVNPRPIAWISTQSSAGVNNLAPYSFFNVVSCNPPVLMVSHLQPQSGQDKDTLTNLLETQECVVNVVNSAQVKPLSVADAPVRYECRLREVSRLSSLPMGGTMILLDVLSIYVADELLLDGGMIKQPLIDTVGKMGGDWYSNTRELFEMKRP